MSRTLTHASFNTARLLPRGSISFGTGPGFSLVFTLKLPMEVPKKFWYFLDNSTMLDKTLFLFDVDGTLTKPRQVQFFY